MFEKNFESTINDKQMSLKVEWTEGGNVAFTIERHLHGKRLEPTICFELTKKEAEMLALILKD